MPAFQYHHDILTEYPDVRGGVIIARGVDNGPTPDALQMAFLTEQRATLARIGETPLSDLPTLMAWRKVFRSFGVNPTKYRSAPEALLRRLTKKGDIPTINALVDISNLVSIRYALPVAAFNTRGINQPITVHFADGSERYTPLGEDMIEHPEPGEVVFSDETRLVVARRWCWRQSAGSAARSDTTEVIITVESQHPGGQEDVESALNDLTDLLKQYVGGDFVSDILRPGNPSIGISP